MPRRHRHFRRSRRGHAARKYISLAGKVIGGAIVAGPAINVFGGLMSNPSAVNVLPQNLLYAYTGIQPDGNWNPNQAGIAAGSVIGGIVVMKIFSWVAKRF